MYNWLPSHYLRCSSSCHQKQGKTQEGQTVAFAHQALNISHKNPQKGAKQSLRGVTQKVHDVIMRNTRLTECCGSKVKNT